MISLLAYRASAQSNVAITYSIGFGTGDLGDFVSAPSFRGVTFDFRKMVQPNIGVGLTFGWNVFYDELASDTYTLGNASLTGKQYRYSNNFPMLATGTYFLKPDETVNPFVGMGIGTIYTLRNTDMNLYTLEQEAWNFALVPEVGIQYALQNGACLHTSLKYNYGFKAGNELDAAQSYLSLNIGFAFKN
jgi:outer membrane protein